MDDSSITVIGECRCHDAAEKCEVGSGGRDRLPRAGVRRMRRPGRRGRLLRGVACPRYHFYRRISRLAQQARRDFSYLEVQALLVGVNGQSGDEGVDEAQIDRVVALLSELVPRIRKVEAP